MIFLSKLKVFGEVNVRHYDPLNTLTNTYFCMTFDLKKYFQGLVSKVLRLSHENIFLTELKPK